MDKKSLWELKRDEDFKKLIDDANEQLRFALREENYMLAAKWRDKIKELENDKR